MQDKLRLLVLTDISTLCAQEGEPDDTQSLIRLLLYSDCFEIEGLVATYTSHHPGKVFPEYIHAIVEKYGCVRRNLLKHSPGYPKTEALLNVIKSGSSVCGLENVGENKDTQASDWIIRVVDKATHRGDYRPLWIAIWGGSLDLAQALWRVKKERTQEEFEKFCNGIRVYSIADQYDTCGDWIRENCPKVMYLTAYHAFRGMYRGGDESLSSAEWVEENVIQGHGILGASYPNYNGGDPWGSVKGMKEGDTPSFLYLIPNGLGRPEMPECCSWGGNFRIDFRRVNEFGKQFVDEKSEADGEISERAGVYRFRDVYQSDFQARLDWCVSEYGEANHPPVAIIRMKQDQLAPGESLHLDGSDSTDPDGDGLNYRWWIDEGACSEGVRAKINAANTVSLKNFHGSADMCEAQVNLHISPDSEKGQVHVILEVTDQGTPALTRYCRVIVEVV